MWIEFVIVDYPCYDEERKNHGVINRDRIEVIMIEQMDNDWHVCIQMSNGDLAFVYNDVIRAVQVYEAFRNILRSKATSIDGIGQIDLFR